MRGHFTANEDSTIYTEQLQITMGNRQFSSTWDKRLQKTTGRYMQIANKHMKGVQVD